MKTPKFRPRLESLGDRVLPSIALTDGILDVEGTAGADDVVVQMVGENAIEVTNSTTGETQAFGTAEIREITIHVGLGNDTVQIAGNVTVNATVCGGRGRDTIQGGGGNDTLRGGRGQDTLDGGGGDDTVNGGYGDDTIHGGDGINALDGGNGINTIYDGVDDHPRPRPGTTPRVVGINTIYDGVDDHLSGDAQNGNGAPGDGQNGDGAIGDGQFGDGQFGDGQNGDGVNGDGQFGDGQFGDDQNNQNN